LRHVFHHIEDIVHAGDQLVNLVAIERRDDRLVQQRYRLMRDVVGLLLVALDIPPPQLELADIVEQRFELRGGEHRQVGVLVEEIEELSFAAQKAGHRGLYSIAGRRDYRTAGTIALNRIRRCRERATIWRFAGSPKRAIL